MKIDLQLETSSMQIQIMPCMYADDLKVLIMSFKIDQHGIITSVGSTTKKNHRQQRRQWGMDTICCILQSDDQ